MKFIAYEYIVTLCQAWHVDTLRVTECISLKRRLATDGNSPSGDLT